MSSLNVAFFSLIQLYFQCHLGEYKNASILPWKLSASLLLFVFFALERSVSFLSMQEHFLLFLLGTLAKNRVTQCLSLTLIILPSHLKHNSHELENGQFDAFFFQNFVMSSIFRLLLFCSIFSEIACFNCILSLSNLLM